MLSEDFINREHLGFDVGDMVRHADAAVTGKVFGKCISLVDQIPAKSWKDTEGPFMEIEFHDGDRYWVLARYWEHG